MQSPQSLHFMLYVHGAINTLKYHFKYDVNIDLHSLPFISRWSFLNSNYWAYGNVTVQSIPDIESSDKVEDGCIFYLDFRTLAQFFNYLTCLSQT